MAIVKAGECKRCGTCCKKGGPALHSEDINLVERGFIPLKCLFTIRRGEPAYDNVNEEITPAESDIIKIKSEEGHKSCIFFDFPGISCNIYENRPMECRALKCWDTDEIKGKYSRNRLTRQDLLENVEGLWQLVQDHQDSCSYQRISTLVAQGGAEVAKELAIMIKYDSEIRALVCRKGNMDQGMLEFLFGRPLQFTIKMFGMNLG